MRLLGVLGLLLLLCAGSTAFGQGRAGTPTVPDTTTFAVNYATALPRPVFEYWEQDYAKYERFMTPEIKRTQMGLSFVLDGVSTWRCLPSATPHAQLDTLTRILDPKALEGRWESVVCRSVVHRDSAVLKEQRFYRSARLVPKDERIFLTFSEGRITVMGQHGKSPDLDKILRKKYTVVSGRYLLAYGGTKAGGIVYHVGIDPSDRLILQSCIVTERKIRGQYLTYETVLLQNICKRL